jgi:hypothetical protein
MTKYTTAADITGSDEFLALNPGLRQKPAKPADKTEARKLWEKLEREDFARKFESAWQRCGGPELETEYQFYSERGWAADYRVGRWLIELDGGVFSGGRHTRALGYIEDCMKLNKAAMLGYQVIRIPTGCATDNYVSEIIERIKE